MQATQPIGLVGRVFHNGLEDWGSIRDWVILKTQKMVLNTFLLNAQHYKGTYQGYSGAIEGNELHLFLHLIVVAIEKGTFDSPSTTTLYPFK